MNRKRKTFKAKIENRYLDYEEPFDFSDWKSVKVNGEPYEKKIEVDIGKVRLLSRPRSRPNMI